MTLLVVDGPLKPSPALDSADLDQQLTATLIGSVGMLSTPLRTVGQPLRLPLMYGFTVEYRAWIEVIRLTAKSRSPMMLARVVLCRALLELNESDGLRDSKRAEADASSARRRRRAWMTINGHRHLGVGADASHYRSVAVKVDDRLIVAVIPVAQETVEVQLSTTWMSYDQRRAIDEAFGDDLQPCDSRRRAEMPGRSAGDAR